MGRNDCFDEKCLDLVQYFYPKATRERQRALAQRIQDEVEAEDIERPAPETKSSPDLGFGIANLIEMVKERMAKGSSQDAAIADVADYAELRSEAIAAIKNALNRGA